MAATAVQTIAVCAMRHTLEIRSRRAGLAVLEKRHLLHGRLIRLIRRRGAGGALLSRNLLGLRQYLRKASEIGLDQGPITHLMERRCWMHHRYNQACADTPGLAMDASNALAGKPAGHRKAPQGHN